MKNLAFAVVALGMVACGNSPRVIDSGPITLPDSGPGHDTGPTPGNDTGPASGTCGSVTATATNPFPALPAGCLPRCAGATVTAYNACVTTYQASGMTMADQTTLQNCENTALRNDHTATATVGAGGTDTVPVSCGGNDTDTFACIEWQTLAAESASCGMQLAAYITCVNGLAAGADPMTGCPTEYNNRAMCRTTNMAAIQSAANMLGSMCFGS